VEWLAIIPILGLLMIAHELGHFIVARKSGIVVEEFAIGFPPRIFSHVGRDGIRYSLNLVPLGAYVKMLGEEDPTAPGSFASQSKRVRAAVLVAGSAMNFIVAVAAFSFAYGTGWPDTSNAPVEIGSTAPESPAQMSGLRSGDVVRAVDGREVRAIPDFQREIQTHLGRPMELTLQRDGGAVQVVVTPRSEWPEGQGALGVQLVRRAVPVPHDPIQSIGFGIRRTLDVIALTFVAPVMANWFGQSAFQAWLRLPVRPRRLSFRRAGGFPFFSSPAPSAPAWRSRTCCRSLRSTAVACYSSSSRLYGAVASVLSARPLFTSSAWPCCSPSWSPSPSTTCLSLWPNSTGACAKRFLVAQTGD
jgi:membrane-associated protease RseP (regulator of RpoE activity)